MTKPHTTSIERAYSQTIDAFMALSRVYLDCTDHLAHSAIAVSREALEECVAATKSSATGRGATAPTAVPAALGQSLMEKTLAYTRDSFETITNAQVESAHIIGQQFAVPATYFPVSEDWKGVLDQFTRTFRDYSATAAATFVEAADSARTSSHVNKAA